MNNAILDNAYGILGLLPNSTQKELSRRIKEIEKLLQIEEIPEYSFDFGFYRSKRSLSDCKVAIQKVSTSKTQLLHYFFRVYASNNKTEDFLRNIDNNFSYERILEYYKTSNSLNFIEKKNIAILLSLLLLTRTNCSERKSIVDLNINIWKEIFDNEKSYKDFKKLFLLDDELGVDESICDNFEATMLEELTNIFSDIASIQNDQNILAEFIKQFNLENRTFNIKQVEDIYKNIDTSIHMLKSMNISEDGIFDDNEKATVKKCLESFQTEFNKLIDLNLYEHEKTIILRDLAATTIRLQILDLFNNLDEDEVSLNLMKFAVYIAGTEGLKSKLKDELKYISSAWNNSQLNELFNKLDNFNAKSFISISSLTKLFQTIDEIIEEAMVIENDSNKVVDFIDNIVFKVRDIAIDICNTNKNYDVAKQIIEKLLLISKKPDTNKLLIKDIEKIKELNPSFIVQLLRGLLAFIVFIFRLLSGYIGLAIIAGIFCFIAWLYDTIGLGGICTIVVIGLIIFFSLNKKS